MGYPSAFSLDTHLSGYLDTPISFISTWSWPNGYIPYLPMDQKLVVFNYKIWIWDIHLPSAWIHVFPLVGIWDMVWHPSWLFELTHRHSGCQTISHIPTRGNTCIHRPSADGYPIYFCTFLKNLYIFRVIFFSF